MRLKTGFGLGVLAVLAIALPVSSASALTVPLYAFGADTSGQLGDAGTIGFGANPNPVLVTLPGISGLVDRVSAGAEFSLVLTSGDQLYSFGENNAGQLGRTATAEEATPALVALPGIEGEVTQAAAGYNFSLVVTSAVSCTHLVRTARASSAVQSTSDSRPRPTRSRRSSPCRERRGA